MREPLKAVAFFALLTLYVWGLLSLDAGSEQAIAIAEDAR